MHPEPGSLNESKPRDPTAIKAGQIDATGGNADMMVGWVVSAKTRRAARERGPSMQ